MDVRVVPHHSIVVDAAHEAGLLAIDGAPVLVIGDDLGDGEACSERGTIEDHVDVPPVAGVLAPRAVDESAFDACCEEVGLEGREVLADHAS